MQLALPGFPPKFRPQKFEFWTLLDAEIRAELILDAALAATREVLSGTFTITGHQTRS